MALWLDGSVARPGGGDGSGGSRMLLLRGCYCLSRAGGAGCCHAAPRRRLPIPPASPTVPFTSTPRHLPQADLIGNAKETAKDGKMRLLLHRQWAEAQDDKELQQVMRGLKNGFSRRRGAGFLDDEVG